MAGWPVGWTEREMMVRRVFPGRSHHLHLVIILSTNYAFALSVYGIYRIGIEDDRQQLDDDDDNDDSAMLWLLLLLLIHVFHIC